MSLTVKPVPAPLGNEEDVTTTIRNPRRPAHTSEFACLTPSVSMNAAALQLKTCRSTLSYLHHTTMLRASNASGGTTRSKPALWATGPIR